MKMTTQLDPQKHAWLQDAGLLRIQDAIKSAGGEARPVGGAVRDALLGRDVKEIDLAVNLVPDKVTELLVAAGIKVVPTGIEHGTVTAVVDKKPYELTTLRRDIETFGRRATVAFTDDWQEDAARRDFTFNALYVDADGTLYDYFDGVQDLNAGHVRFIGDAHERIKEDVLRIFRFFRFYAWFGRGDVDRDGLQACVQLASLLPQLSVERVWREIVKLLFADNPMPSWQLMLDGYVLAQLLPEADNLARLQALLTIEQKYEVPPVPLLRLAALLPPHEAAMQTVADKLKLSNREADYLKNIAPLPSLLKGKLDPVPFRRAMYAYGGSAAHDAALLLATEIPGVDLEPILEAAAVWEKPIFPLQGSDILVLGIKPGPRVGELLRTVEDWWVNQDFRPERDACLAELRRIL